MSGCAPEAHDPVHPASFDGPLTLQHESELDEELGRGREVVHHDADVLHTLTSHVLAPMVVRAQPSVSARLCIMASRILRRSS